MNAVLTIAGSDCSGGAGIQADIKTITMHGAYAMSVITALTAQNTTGVSGIQKIEAEFIGAQLDAVFSDIPPQAVKVGMIFDQAAAEVVSERLQAYHAKHIVIDTVMASTSGTSLADQKALDTSAGKLYPLAELLTPNIPEAEALSGIEVLGRDTMQQAAQIISQKYGCAVLCKGGHLTGMADDLLYDRGQFYWLKGRRIDNPNTHGTGCTLSSAIACRLAEGMELPDAVRGAKEYLTNAIADALDLGTGRGPLNHSYMLRNDLSITNKRFAGR